MTQRPCRQKRSENRYHVLQGALSWGALLLATVGQGAAAERPWPLTAQGLFPTPGASEICPDTPLKVTFPTPPALGPNGKIQIFDVSTDTVVDTIDLNDTAPTKTIGGFDNFKYHPVIITGRQAVIYPRNGTLACGKSYYVKVDAGVFRAGVDSYGAIADATTWRFATRKGRPEASAAKLTVAADGSGDFCTVQGALDFLPEGNIKPVTIFVKRGTYAEIIAFTERNRVTLLGEDRKETIITYANNANFNDGGGNPFGGPNANPSAEHRGGKVYHRGVLLGHRVNDFTLANLTIRNTTPAGGSQAEAIILNGSTTAHAILKDVDLYSRQDTLQINGQAYVTNCRIEGDVDFMWGTGPCFFEGVTAVTIRSGAFFTQIRNPATNHGYVFVNCIFDGAQGVQDNYLSRIGTGRFPNSEVVLINCALGSCVNDVAWQFSGGNEGNPKDPAKVHFWEFESHDLTGQPVDDSKRLAGSRRLARPADATVIENYRDPIFVLGGNWDPRKAAIFSHHP